MASVIAPIASHWISIERRRLIQVIPKAIGKIWDRWDVRAAVLASFVAQSILTIVGNMRKINRQDGDMKVLVWMCYLMSDWLVNFALDMISSKLGDYSVDPSIKPEDDPAIMAFWAAFMLVHFGGPHSITAYALEDNALWLRSFFISLLQSGRVLYIILLVWRNTCLSYITIAMLVVGCIKCWEKTWALYSASIDTHRDKLLTPPSQSHHVSVGGDEHAHHPYSATTNPTELIRNFMRFFVSLFTDLVISDEDLLKDQSAFRALEAEQAFKQVGDELGHAYDIFYTKAFVRSQTWGQLFKFITLSITIIVLLFFQIKRFMLPIGTGLVACRDTFAEIRRFLILKGLEIPPYKRLMLDIKSYWKQKRNSLTTLGAQPQPQDHDDVESEENDYELCLRQICDKLLEQDRGIVFSIQDGRIVSIIKTKSALSDARKLARSLRHDMESKEVMWEFLANVWVEILGYAAINCRADHHAQQLRRGGEFLSHVWLLMAHLGLMEQFQLKPQNPPHQSHSNHP